MNVLSIEWLVQIVALKVLSKNGKHKVLSTNVFEYKDVWVILLSVNYNDFPNSEKSFTAGNLIMCYMRWEMGGRKKSWEKTDRTAL